jgi:hypothetical protein
MFLLRFLFIALVAWLGYYWFRKMTSQNKKSDSGNTRPPGNQAPGN